MAVVLDAEVIGRREVVHASGRQQVLIEDAPEVAGDLKARRKFVVARVRTRGIDPSRSELAGIDTIGCGRLMQPHERVGVQPVTAWPGAPIHDRNVDVGPVDQRIRERESRRAGTNDQIVRLDLAHTASADPGVARARVYARPVRRARDPPPALRFSRNPELERSRPLHVPSRDPGRQTRRPRSTGPPRTPRRDGGQRLGVGAVARNQGWCRSRRARGRRRSTTLISADRNRTSQGRRDLPATGRAPGPPNGRYKGRLFR